MAEPARQQDFDGNATARLIATMADALGDLLQRDATAGPVVLVGIASGGVHVARELHAALAQRGTPAELGTLDASFHRDDFSRRGLRTTSEPSDLPLTLEDARVVLVDDVLHTGRTVRAALEGLFERGRPQSVRLAALVTRPGRQLPIQADVSGIDLDVDAGTRVSVQPDPLRITLEPATE